MATKKLTAVAAALACLAALLHVPHAAAQNQAQTEPTVNARQARNQQITWEECPPQVNEEAAKCGRIQVPMNYNDPDGQKISVGFVKLPAKNQGARRGTLFTNSGGPGGDVYAFTAHNKEMKWPEGIRSEWDMVGVQPRGLIGSTPVECTNENVAVGPLDQYVNVGKIVRDVCATGPAGFLDSLTTENTARDWEEVRKALGIETVSILGLSYGTVLGSAYATMYPQHTDRVVLDSATDPEAFWNTLFDAQRPGYVRNLHEFFNWAAKHDDVYHLGTTPYAVYEKWSAKIAEESGVTPSVRPPALDANAAAFGSSVPGSSAPGSSANDVKAFEVLVQNFVSQMLKPGANQSSSPTLTNSFTIAPRTERWRYLAAHINGSKPIALELSEAQKKEIVNSVNMQLITICNENNTPARREQLPAYLWNRQIKGDIFEQHLVFSSGVSCGGTQPVTRVPALDGSKLRTRPLQVQGTGDPQTPYELSLPVQQRMNSQLITVVSVRHGHVGFGHGLVDDAVVEYLRTDTTSVTNLPGEDIPTRVG